MTNTTHLGRFLHAVVASCTATVLAVSCGSDFSSANFTTGPDGGIASTGGGSSYSNGGHLGSGATGSGTGSSRGDGGSGARGGGGSSGNAGFGANGGGAGGPSGGVSGSGGASHAGAGGAGGVVGSSGGASDGGNFGTGGGTSGGSGGMTDGGGAVTGGATGSGGTSSGGNVGAGGAGGNCADSGQSCGTMPCCGKLMCCTGGPFVPSGVGGFVTIGVCRALCPISDRNLKQGFESVEPNDVLERVSSLPISTWSYQAEPSARHIGPMAQDFMATFSVGSDERTIQQVDADGVELAAIQALRARLGRVEAENRNLQRALEALESRFNELETHAWGAGEQTR